MERMYINGDVLKAVRLKLNMPLEVVASRCSKTVTAERIERWESNLDGPSYTMLENLAYNIYKVPIAIFFFSEAPDLTKFKESMRTLDPNAFNLIPSQIVQILRKAHGLQLNLNELFEVNRAERKIIRDLQIAQNPDFKSIALKIREYLGLTFNDQKLVTSSETLLKDMRVKLEDVGIYTFKDAFKDKMYSGFCLYDKEFPVIYINNSMTFNRQLFTLFHELSHLLLGISGLDFADTRTPVEFYSHKKNTEIFCNKLAAEILVPSQFFQEYENGHFNDIQEIASKFNVSNVVIARKLLDLGRINQAEYQSIAEGAKSYIRKVSNKDGGNYYNTKISYLGKTYILEVLRKMNRNQISQYDASSFLGEKVQNINKLQQKMY